MLFSPMSLVMRVSPSLFAEPSYTHLKNSTTHIRNLNFFGSGAKE